MYILINLFVSGVGFAKSFLFMKWLDMTELGIISLVQTVMLFVGLFQLGLLNGGYRIFALDKAEQQREINNLLFTYIGCLSFLGVLIWCILHVCNITLVLKSELLLVAFVCGILALTNNWLTNTLIGKGLISNINKVNTVSALISLLLLPLVMFFGIRGAIVVLISQPLIFVAITLFQNKSLRPTAFNFNLSLVRYILSFGFIPFISGIFTLVNLQIERWSIAEILGPDALGKYYLVFLYSTLFTLVPSSLNSLFFPKAVKAYEQGESIIFKRLIVRYTILLLLYIAFTLISSYTLLQPIIDYVFPQHASNTIYVFYLLPGLAAYLLCDPISLIMNSMVKLRMMFISGLLSVITICIGVFITNYLSIFSLTGITLIKDIAYFLVLFIYIAFLFKERQHLFSSIIRR